MRKGVTWLGSLLEVALGQEMWRKGTLGRGHRTREREWDRKHIVNRGWM